MQPLFDVVVGVSGDPYTGAHRYDVTIINRYYTDWDVIGEYQAPTIVDAIEYARGAVTAFLNGTQAKEPPPQ